MLHLSSSLRGFALMAGLIVTIGAQNAFVLRQGLRREHVGAVVAFCVLADAALTAAGVAGAGAALGGMPGLARALALGGAAFLGWYGVEALRRAVRPGALRGGDDPAALSLRTALGRAAAFTLLNPHVYIDTVMLAGSVGAAEPDGGGGPSFVLGAGAASALWFVGLGYGARLLAPVFARPAAWRVLDGTVAALMAALCLVLLREGLA